MNEAVRRIQKLTPAGEDLDTAYKGEPLFLFSGLQGKTKELNSFWDSGNSHTLFQKDVPGQELLGVKVRAGPFPMGAVGNTTVWANDE